MKRLMVGGLAALMWLGTTLAIAADKPDSWDGLIEIKPKRLDAAYLLPGADFRKYTKVMMDPVEVAFKKDWAENYNREAATLSQRLTPERVEDIAKAARDGFTEVFTEAYKKAGLELVTAPGADVLRRSARRRGSLHRGAGQHVRRPLAHVHDGVRPGDPVPRGARFDDGCAARPRAGPPRDARHRHGADQRTA